MFAADVDIGYERFSEYYFGLRHSRNEPKYKIPYASHICL